MTVTAYVLISHEFHGHHDTELVALLHLAQTYSSAGIGVANRLPSASRSSAASGEKRR